MKTRYQTLYLETLRPALIKEFGYKNIMQVPRLEKIVVNVGVGEATQDSKLVDAAAAEIALITGQRPVKTLAKKSIAAFKVREQMPLGVKVTLRRERDVRVSRSVDHHCPAAGSRFSRGESQKLRWSGELCPWVEGADCVPRDRL